MASLSFTKAKGKAESSKVPYLDIPFGETSVRLVGGILPRYVYWVRGPSGKAVPVECLAFERETESFNNANEDPVREKFPELKSGWAYAINCIDRKDGEVKVFALKSRLFREITDAAETLGDPTDPKDGWDVVFKKTKTGPNAMNVEYSLQVLKCKKTPLTDEEIDKVGNAKLIEEFLPRLDAAGIREQLDRIENFKGKDDEGDDGDVPPAEKESHEDIPF